MLKCRVKLPLPTLTRGSSQTIMSCGVDNDGMLLGSTVADSKVSRVGKAFYQMMCYVIAELQEFAILLQRLCLECLWFSFNFVYVFF